MERLIGVLQPPVAGDRGEAGGVVGWLGLQRCERCLVGALRAAAAFITPVGRARMGRLSRARKPIL